jgi:outer membrane protein OmpA-like peptidoglycan-associated protein
LHNNFSYKEKKESVMQIKKKLCSFVFTFFVLINVLHAQAEFPRGNFWSMNTGIGMSSILVEGTSYQMVLEPKLWLSSPLMVGSKIGMNYSTDEILTFEGQVYLRWNFLQFVQNRQTSMERSTDFFIQGGLGMLAAYRGADSPMSDVTMTRGSLMFDAAAGVTIPLSSRWHIEPSIRGGFPHIIGASITAGYKFPLRQREITEYVEIIRTVPQNEIIRRVMISAVEFVLFGPDTGEYNVGIDHDAEGLNELVLDHTARMLTENPDFRVRIEGHANPVTTDPEEAEELMNLSSMRANVVADQLRARGVPDDQKVVIAFGGTRTVTSEHDIWNRNRRVELTIVQVDAN